MTQRKSAKKIAEFADPWRKYSKIVSFPNNIQEALQDNVTHKTEHLQEPWNDIFVPFFCPRKE
jgi:hypothetical protein